MQRAAGGMDGAAGAVLGPGPTTAAAARAAGAAAASGEGVDQGLLAGTRPALPFHSRLNHQHAKAGLVGDLLLLAMHLAFLRRSGLTGGLLGLDAASVAWQAGTLGLLALSLAWRAAAPASHLRWRELLAALLRLTSLGLGLGAAHVWQLVHDSAGAPAATGGGGGGGGGEGWGPPQLAGAEVVHAARLMFASCAGSLLLAHITLRMRPSLSALAQLGLVATLIPHTRAGCSGPAMSHPSAQAATQSLYSLMSWLGAPLPLPLAPYAAPSEAQQCQIIVAWFQLAPGLLLPLFFEALAAAAAFAQHQRQRAEAGLPPEAGPHAWLYAAVHGTWGDGDELGPAIPPLLMAWLLSAVAWDWSVFFIGRPAA